MSRRGAPNLQSLLQRLLPQSRRSETPTDPAAEPQRLADMDQLDEPNLRWGAELIRRAGPVVPSRTMQARVRLELDRHDAPLRPRLRLVRWAPLAALFLAAGAGATVGRGWLGAVVGSERSNQTDERLTVQTPVVPGRAAPTTRVPSADVDLGDAAGAAVVTARKVEVPLGEQLLPGTTVETAAKPVVNSIPKAEAVVDTPPKVHATRPPEVANLGSQLIVDALQARRAKRYVEVSTLTQKYLAQYPRGPLVEEALGLAMEAAANTRSAQRQVLAQRYLDRFPNGRFQATAQRILRAP